MTRPRSARLYGRRRVGAISKRTPFGRVLAASFIDPGDDGLGTIRYLHPTKGYRTRQATPEMFQNLLITTTPTTPEQE